MNCWATSLATVEIPSLLSENPHVFARIRRCVVAPENCKAEATLPVWVCAQEWGSCKYRKNTKNVMHKLIPIVIRSDHLLHLVFHVTKLAWSIGVPNVIILYPIITFLTTLKVEHRQFQCWLPLMNNKLSIRRAWRGTIHPSPHKKIQFWGGFHPWTCAQKHSMKSPTFFHPKPYIYITYKISRF